MNKRKFRKLYLSLFIIRKYTIINTYLKLINAIHSKFASVDTQPFALKGIL